MATSVPYDYDRIWREVYGDMQKMGPAHRHVRRNLRRLLAGLDYRSLLDVACGAGGNLPLLCAGRTLNSVAGVDISEEALSRARELWPDGDFSQLDIQEGHLDGTWDLVVSAFVLEHLPDDEAALRNMRAMTGKQLLVGTIAGNFERYRAWDEQVGHVRNYAVGELEEKLGRAGFEVERTIYWGFPFYTPLARTLQNRQKSEAEYSGSTRLIAQIMYLLYFLNSSRKGDILFALARPG